MASRSYSNLLELVEGSSLGDDSSSMGSVQAGGMRRMVGRGGGGGGGGGMTGGLRRAATVSGIYSESREEEGSRSRGDESVSTEASVLSEENRMLIVAHILPLNAAPGPDGRSWSFEWDRDSLLWQLKDGLPDEMEVIYIGCLKVEVDSSEQDEVAATLLENFNCVPAFLPTDLKNRFYHGFCKQMLWPLFHYLLPLSAAHGGRFNRSYWQAYVSVNKVRFCTHPSTLLQNCMCKNLPYSPAKASHGIAKQERERSFSRAITTKPSIIIIMKSSFHGMGHGHGRFLLTR
jgi:trehalose 6-phosphate synthase/phosphatase